MYTIEKKFYGYNLVFGDTISEEEMTKWRDEAKTALESQEGSFGVFVDMRTLKPLSEGTKMIMQEGQKAFKEKGMERSVVILANAVITLQFKEIAKKSGIYEWERYLDASSVDNWEKVGEDWIARGEDPDKK